jgi:hypothetical protein
VVVEVVQMAVQVVVAIAAHKAYDDFNNFILYVHKIDDEMLVRVRALAGFSDQLYALGGNAQQWNHVVFTNQDTDHRLYINGELLDVYTGNAITDQDEIVFGRIDSLDRNTWVTSDYNGSVDEILIFNRSLSEEEVKAIYNDGAGINLFEVSKGLISDTLGDTPFYTNESNPRTINLNAGQSQLVTAWVNATGEFGDYIFFEFANRIKDMLTDNITSEYTIEIIDKTPPLIEFVPPTPNETFITELFVNISSSDDNDHYTFLDFDDSLVGWWRFEESSWNGTAGEVKDESGFDNHGRAYGDANTIADGRFGRGGEFDGNGDYIKSDGQDIREKITLSVWVNAGDGERGYLLKDGTYMGDGAFTLQRGATGIITFYLNGTVVWTENLSSIGEWYHIVATYDGSLMKIYLNGILENEQEREGELAEHQWWIAGGGRSGYYFNGSIDDVLIFNRALSEDEIKSLYNATANQYQNNFTDLNNDEYTFKGYAVDTAGNKNETETREVFYIDMPPEGYLVYHNFTSPYLLFNGDGVEIESGNRTTNPVLIVKRLYAYDPFLEFTIKGDVNLNPVDVDVLIDTIFTRTVVSGLDQIPNVTGKHSLFVSNMGYGIYICPHAQSINEINLFCPDYATFDCPGTLGNYSCIVLGDFYKVSGLSGSGVAADLPFDWAQIPEFSTLGIVLAVILILLSTFFIRREKGKI